MKVLIYILIYRRESIRDEIIEGLQKFMNAGYERGIESRLFIVYSRQKDFDYWNSRIKIDYHQYSENRPLGRKLNSGLQQIYNIEFDWFLQLGCDDLLKPGLWDCFLKYKDQGEVLGCTNLKVIDQPTGRVKRLEAKMIFGAGRFTRADILKNAINCYNVIGKVSDTSGVRRGRKMTIAKHEYNPKTFDIESEVYQLWDDWREGALDTNSQNNLIKRNKEVRFVKIDGDKYLVTDIKTPENINSFDKLN